MFTRRKTSVEHLPGLEGPALRQGGQVRPRQPSPRRSSFHGSESHPDSQPQNCTQQDRKKKYATVPIIHHNRDGERDHDRGEKPPTLPKTKNLPQAPYQKTFIAMLRNKDGKSSKRRSTEIYDSTSPVTPPPIPPKPTTGVFYQPLPNSHSAAPATVPLHTPAPVLVPLHTPATALVPLRTHALALVPFPLRIPASAPGRAPAPTPGPCRTSCPPVPGRAHTPPRLMHAANYHHHEQVYHTEPLPNYQVAPHFLPAGRLSAVQQKKKSGAHVNRSESLKEKQHSRKRARESRKHSDPNIPTSKSGDVDAESGLNAGHSGSSSNSSLSHSQESPSTSLEQVSRGEPVRTEPPLPAPVLDNDSDIEAEVDLPNWQRLVPSEDIKRLKPKERKRQDTINELFHTERSHVRVLKVVKHLFQVPMTEAELLPKDQLEILFPNLDQMLEIHMQFNQAMKKRRQEEALVTRVGDLVIDMFDGEAGERFQQQAGLYMRTQFLALEGLKTRQKRDQRLASFLQEQENNPACRRLQLKDMLPAGFQRLSKYPLLLELLLGYTDASARPEEHEQISRALERSREILAFVNNAVEEAENTQRLAEIQRKLDQSSLAKSKHGQSDELRGNLDLTKHKLVYEGPLTWRIAKGQKNIDLLVLLLDEFIVLLQKTDDKYVLKNHSIIKSLSKDENKLTHSPIIKYGPPSMLFRAVATDNCAFFIVTTQAVGAQIYELVASSPSERKVWFRHIQEAQEAYTARDGRRHRPHPSTPIHDPDDQPPPPSDALPDVEDSNVEVEGGEAGSEATGDASDASRTLPSAPRTPEQGKADDAPTQPSPASPDTLAKKTAEAAGGPGTPTPTPPAPTPGRSPAQGRRLQEVQIIQIVEGPTLIQPSEVKVSQGLVLSAQPVLTPIEHLRRKDLKIRQALEEKQLIIADILNIPQEHFESVVDMAGEPSVGNKEPKELVLAAMFQAKCLQETLNEALSINEADIVAARANSEARPAPSIPLYQAPMSKLMCISTTLSQQLSSLLNLVSERDDERERMRKELVASRERLHQLHMLQNSIPTQAPTTTPVGAQPLPPAVSPHTSRPNSFVSVASSAAEHSDTPEHHDTDEDGSGEGAKVNNTEETDQAKEETIHETFEDAGSRGEATERSKSGDGESSTTAEEGGEEGPGGEEGGGETSTT